MVKKEDGYPQSNDEDVAQVRQRKVLGHVDDTGLVINKRAKQGPILMLGKPNPFGV